MNRTDSPAPRCELEDRVVAAFLDGEPDTDAGMLASHLDECEACAEAVRQSRELEALLASQTRTDVDDATADRLLAGIAAAPCARATVALPPVHRLRRFGFAAAAAALVIGLVCGWIFLWGGSGDEPGSDRTPDRVAKMSPPPRVPDAPRNPGLPRVAAASPTPAVTTGFILPGSRSPRKVVRKPATDADVLRRIEGEGKLDLDRRVVTARAIAWLTPEEAAADPGEAKPATIDPRHTAAAARWLLGEIRRGWLAPDRALLPARHLLTSRGELRRQLVTVFRTHDDVLSRLVRRRSYRGRPDGEVVALIGAVGCADLMSVVRGLNVHELNDCVVEARRTGDTRCLTFLVDLFLHGAVRRSAVRLAGPEWFRPTLAAAGDDLVELVRRRAARSRNRASIAVGDQLLIQLGLAAETCLLARAEPGTGSPGPTPRG